MNDRELLYRFFNCGDNEIIEFAMMRARLNRREKEVIENMIDNCMTQEEVAEQMGYSVRRVQQFWSTGATKLLNIPWVKAYASFL